MIAGLPYDAEVEYIDSVVPAYIDTGIPIDSSDITIICDAAFLSDAGALSSMLGTDGDYFCLIRLYESSGKIEMWWRGWKAYLPSDASDLFRRHSFKFASSGETFVDGTEIGYAWGHFNGRTNPTIKISAYNAGNTTRQGQCRYWGFKILGSDEHTVMDMIPVRFTNGLGVSEGAMYDRVSRKLFRNAGTGAFVTGPDVATPVMGLHFMPRPKYTAKSYIRDGLIAMWDGIENAGWGVHDPNATTWKDLSGNGFDCDVTALTGTGSLVFEEKSVLKTGYITTQPYDTDYSTEHWTIEAAINFLTRDNNNNHSGVGVYPVAIAINYSQIIYGQYTSATNHLRRAFYGIRPASERQNSLGTLAHVQSGYSSDTSNNATYRNGEPIANSPGGWSGGGLGNMQIAAVISGNSPNANQRIYCIRIYNRALSASEIAANYAVDKERFNLP